MPILPLRRDTAIVGVCVYLTFHTACVIAFPNAATALSNALTLLGPAIATVLCWRTAARSGPQLRLCAMLFATGLMLWTLGMALDTYASIVTHARATFALLPDLLYFFYGVPVLFAVSTSNADQRSPFFLFLYGLQAFVIAYLAYIVLFSGAPFTAEPAAPVPAGRLAQAFLLENICLALAATARLFSWSSNAERTLFRNVALFSWLFLACSGAHRYLLIHTKFGLASDPLIDIPFMVLAYVIAFTPGRSRLVDDQPPESPVALFIASASPIFSTFGMLALGSFVMRRHFAIGAAGIAIALTCYGLGAALLQVRYLRSQQSLREALSRLEGVSLTDGLTGVANRRCFDQTLERECSRAKRSGQKLSLLMLDLDYFKSLNDRYGHVYGDECLMAVARILRAALPREADVVARYGGEEFAVILPDTDRLGAEIVAYKMRDAVRRLGIRNESATGKVVTISIGVSTFEADSGATHLDIIRDADSALYAAKRDGRDRVEFAAATVAADETNAS